jgi:hypothetical protein
MVAIVCMKLMGGRGCCYPVWTGGWGICWWRDTGGAQQEVEDKIVLCISAVDLPMVLALIAAGLWEGPGLAQVALVWLLLTLPLCV